MTLEAAKALIEAEDAAQLRAMLDREPDLVRAREDHSNTLLHFAACQRTVDCVNALLEAGAEVDGPGNDHGTALHWAASLNHVEVCRRLIEAGASLTRSDGLGEGGTPLVQALMYGHREAAEMLSELGIYPNNLRVAAGLGRMDLIHKFFDDNGRITATAGQDRTWYRPHDEFPEHPTTDDPQEVLDEALCYACFNNRPEAAEFLLQHGANPNALPHYATALHLATATENQGLIDLLLKHGADPTILDHLYYSTAAGWAEYAGNEKLAAYLHQKAAATSLQAAIRCGDLAQVREHLDAAEPELICGELGSSWLALAITCQKDAIAQLLRERGAKLTLPTAARLGMLDDLRSLLAAGADPNAVAMLPVPIPCEGSLPRPASALLTAAIHQQHEACELLLMAGAKLDPWSAAALGKLELLLRQLDEGHPIGLEDPFGRTVLHRAIQGDALEAVRLLLDRGARLDQTADFFSCGSRAIHVAAESGASEAVIRLLLERGANLNEPRNYGTPLDCAARAGCDETADLLRSLGGKTEKELGA